MAIAFSCPQCSHKYEVADSFAGAKATCKSCKERIVVPAAPAAEPTKWYEPAGAVAPEPSPAAVAAPPEPEQCKILCVCRKMYVGNPREPRQCPECKAKAASAAPVRQAGAPQAYTPECYDQTRGAGNILLTVNRLACGVLAAGCLVGVVATIEKSPAAAGVLFGGIVVSLLNIAVGELVVGASRVLLDVGMSLRALRAREGVPTS